MPRQLVALNSPLTMDDSVAPELIAAQSRQSNIERPFALSAHNSAENEDQQQNQHAASHCITATDRSQPELCIISAATAKQVACVRPPGGTFCSNSPQTAGF